jgi:diketogulonate reductase-like aldo/keto reductase
VKSIGVSNFNSAQIDDLIKRGMTIPVVNQVESHPYLSQEKLHNWCRQKGIRLTAFSPLARTGTAEKKNTSSPLEDPVMKRIAAKHGKSEAQICVKWQAQRGVIVIPKSATKERIKSNFELFDWQLSDSEMKAINGMNTNCRNNTWCHYGINKHRLWPFAIEY